MITQVTYQYIISYVFIYTTPEKWCAVLEGVACESCAILYYISHNAFGRDGIHSRPLSAVIEDVRIIIPIHKFNLYICINYINYISRIFMSDFRTKCPEKNFFALTTDT